MLSIINNANAVSAQNKLSIAQNGQAKSIQRLSSGLRINSAADDPSGLAISERMRTQVRGLGRASMNAQDAISYMQTAEGALNETHSVLQRMRELSVQAANGTLTSSDRETIQQEVNQLGEEVDRIATSTEFNTKKLLNGDASALWSSSSDKVGAVIRGKVAEGNYKLEIDASPVENHVLKTDVFSVKDGVQAVENVDLNGTKASLVVSEFSATGTGEIIFNFDDGTSRTLAITAASTMSTATSFATTINNDEILSQYMQAEIDLVATSAVVTLKALQDGEYGNDFSVVDSSSKFFATTATQSFSAGDTSASNIVGINNPEGLQTGFSGSASYTLSATATTGQAANDSSALAKYGQTTVQGFTSNSTIEHFGSATITISGISTGGTYLMVEALETGTVTTASDTSLAIRYSFDNGETWNETQIQGGAQFTAAVTMGDANNSVSFVFTGTTTSLNAGDKLLMGFNDKNNLGANYDSMQMKWEESDGQGSTTSESRLFTFTADSIDKSSVSLDVVQLDATSGDWNVGSISVDLGENELATGDVKFDVESGGVAMADTELYKIDRFYDDDGNFILGESGKSITIYNAGGESTSVFIDGMDTIGEVADKFKAAIGEGLGMYTGNSEVDDNIASFVTQGYEGTDEALEGTMVIRSTQMGPAGKLYFSADEDVVNALSLVTINDPDLDPMTITVSDAHSGEEIGSDTVSDNVLRNVIDGVDVEFDASLDIAVEWSETDKKFVFNSEEGQTTEYLHVVDNAKSFQIGANQGQTMDSYIGQMDAHALGVDKVLVVSQEAAQDSIGRLDEAIDRVSSERARIGSVVNRLDHTINNLNVQQENAIAAESRIRDLDIAKEATEMTKNQILVQAATSMLAQANGMANGLMSLLR